MNYEFIFGNARKLNNKRNLKIQQFENTFSDDADS